MRYTLASLITLLALYPVDRSIPDFQVVARSVERQAVKPDETDHSKDLDFWVGEWECTGKMVGPNGQETATKAENSISRILSGQVVQERFTMTGLNGMSVSAYNKATGRWRQTWVDNQGSYIALSGGKVGKDIILMTTPPGTQPQSVNRMVFTNISEPSFDWNWESSVDGGKTWKLQWHLHYVRKTTVPKNQSGEK